MFPPTTTDTLSVDTTIIIPTISATTTITTAPTTRPMRCCRTLRRKRFTTRGARRPYSREGAAGGEVSITHVTCHMSHVICHMSQYVLHGPRWSDQDHIIICWPRQGNFFEKCNPCKTDTDLGVQ